MYSIVLEKEERLQEFMRMNGMRMWNYWLVNFGFDFFVYCLTVGLFFITGVFLVQLQFFTQTSGWLFFFFILGWGIA